MPLFTVTIKSNGQPSRRTAFPEPSTLQASLLDAPVLRKQQGFRQLSRRLRASALLNENSSA